MLVVLEKILGTAPEGPEPFAANAPGNGSSAYFQNFTCLVMWRPITIAKRNIAVYGDTKPPAFSWRHKFFYQCRGRSRPSTGRAPRRVRTCLPTY